MDKASKCCEDSMDPDFLNNIKESIEKELSNLKQIVDSMNQMRVEAAYLESDLLLSTDAGAWRSVADLIGLASATAADAEQHNYTRQQNEPTDEMLQTK